MFDKYQQKIDLPSHDFENGLLANVTGWGLTRQNPVNRPKQLQLIETKIVSREECEKKMSQPGVKVDDIHVCALHIRGRGACSVSLIKISVVFCLLIRALMKIIYNFHFHMPSGG